MICPKCNSEILDELLYCPECGEEIQFVPEYEPEIEQSIHETLSDIVLDQQNADSFLDDDIQYSDSFGDPEFFDDPDFEVSTDFEKIAEQENGYYDDNGNYVDNEKYGDNRNYDEYEYYDENGYYVENDGYYNENGYYDEEVFDEEYDLEDFDEDEPNFLYHFLRFMKESKFRWLVIAIFAVVVIVVCISVYRVTQEVYKKNSYQYQAELAMSAATTGDYATAIIHMERAVLLNSEDTSLKYQLADYYFQNEEDEKAILMLWEIIYEKDVNYQAAYKKIIDYYAFNQNYGMIEEILSNCDDMIVVNQFLNYLANEPEFNYAEGTYDEVIYLTMSSANNGTIYYTMDGTMPTYESPIYSEPIPLELGIYKINAVFVNEYGIESDVISKTYIVDIRVPNPPNVLLASGSFTSPELIEVDVQQFCKVFYTTDGTLPTRESNEYTTPIPMPLGTSHFIFVAYSQENIPGEYTEVDYNLTLDSVVQIQEVVNYIKQYNLNLGKTTDLEGHIVGNTMQYTYMVTSAINLEESTYFIFTEYMIDSMGQSMKTGTIYLADIYDGSLYKGLRDEVGAISRGDLIPPEQYVPIVIPDLENEGNGVYAPTDEG